MFTGLVETVGEVRALQRAGGDARLSVAAPWLVAHGGARVGDSIAVSGVCLTVVGVEGDAFDFDVSGETLAVTTLGALARGARVNLERALTPQTRLGGHLVSGHVDAIGEVSALVAEARSTRLTLALPAALLAYVARKGSLCVDGVSLTVNALAPGHCEINLVPHTLAVTTLCDYRVGTRVNLEVDLLARYLEQLVLGSDAVAARLRGDLR